MRESLATKSSLFVVNSAERRSCHSLCYLWLASFKIGEVAEELEKLAVIASSVFKPHCPKLKKQLYNCNHFNLRFPAESKNNESQHTWNCLLQHYINELSLTRVIRFCDHKMFFLGKRTWSQNWLGIIQTFGFQNGLKQTKSSWKYRGFLKHF